LSIDRSCSLSSEGLQNETAWCLEREAYILVHVASDSVLSFAFSIRDGVVSTREKERERERERDGEREALAGAVNINLHQGPAQFLRLPLCSW